MNKGMHEGSDMKFIPMTSIKSTVGEAVTADVYYYTNQLVNVIFIGEPASEYWYLVDAGMPKSAEEIWRVAEERYGVGAKPKAILLTHGHFDHVGGLVDLLGKWDVPVYAHEAEFPYLTGKQSYPEPDSTVEGGLLAKISAIYPNEPITIGSQLKALPNDHRIPGMTDWEWIHTPGHSPGHVSFYRSIDGLLISGDACITVRQDSFYQVLLQKAEVNGPPRYFTTDWEAAKQSVATIHALHPNIMIPGHGVSLSGNILQEGLTFLVDNFDDMAVPDYGKYS
ncbi:MBL fold metallo-hydrolase [Ornithinibacillus contaminans]|uniref:MBL fold metallo-hydrolase n=1 Tax=Ornithinibacillus contaminans TaxID=694055 RepID=UPI00064D81C3|nr:MBL fold metallo-hydrolase [Ornithinibacillus contaminans]